MNISQGLLEECRYCLVPAEDLGYGDNSHLISQLEEITNCSKAKVKRFLPADIK